MKSRMLARPSALVPMVMSWLALAVVLIHLAWHGTAREVDEGAAAHVFQLLILGQAPFVAYFAFTWVRRAPGQAVPVLALQLAMALAACAPVRFFGL